MVALAAVAASVILHSGQVQWFLPGTLRPSQVVRCSVGRRVVSARVPNIGAADWAWTGHVRMSMSRASNGAVEVACNAQLARRRMPRAPYVIGQNGVALIRGDNHLAQLKRRYGRPTSRHASAGACTVVWGRAGLRTTFTSCTANGVLVRAVVTSTRWSSLTGIHVGELRPRMLFEAPQAKRLTANRWRLASSHGHSLVAELGADGRVARLVATLG
jgi:hypothetical protein